MAGRNSKLRNERLSSGLRLPVLSSSLPEENYSEDARTSLECNRSVEENGIEYLSHIEREILKYVDEIVAKTRLNFHHQKKLSSQDSLRTVSRFSRESSFRKGPRCNVKSSIRSKGCTDVDSGKNLDSSVASRADSLPDTDAERDKAYLAALIAKLRTMNAEEKVCLPKNYELRLSSIAHHDTLKNNKLSGKTDAVNLLSCFERTSDERENAIISGKYGRSMDGCKRCGCNERHCGEAVTGGLFNKPTYEELYHELQRLKFIPRNDDDRDEKFSNEDGSLRFVKTGRTASRMRAEDQLSNWNNLPNHALSVDKETRDVEASEVDLSTFSPSVVDHSRVNFKRSGLFRRELPGVLRMERTIAKDVKSTAAIFELYIKSILEKSGLSSEVLQPLNPINQNKESSRAPCLCSHHFRDAATQCAPVKKVEKKNACTQTSSAFQTCEMERLLCTPSDCSKNTTNCSKIIGAHGESSPPVFPRLGVTEEEGTNSDGSQHIFPALEKSRLEIDSKTISSTEFSKNSRTFKKKSPLYDEIVMETPTSSDRNSKGIILENKRAQHATYCSKDYLILGNECRLQASICSQRRTTSDCSNMDIVPVNCDSPLYEIISSQRRAPTDCSSNYLSLENESRLPTKLGTKRRAPSNFSNEGLSLANKKSSTQTIGSERRASAHCIANSHSSDYEARLQAKLGCRRRASPDGNDSFLAPERVSTLQDSVDSKRRSSDGCLDEYRTLENKSPNKRKLGSKRHASNDFSNNDSLEILLQANTGTKKFITTDVFGNNSQPAHRPKLSPTSGAALENNNNAEQSHYLYNLAMTSDISLSNVKVSDTNVLINVKNTSKKELPICQSPITIRLENYQIKRSPISEENDDTTYEEGVDLTFIPEKNIADNQLKSSWHQNRKGCKNNDYSGKDMQTRLQQKRSRVNLSAVGSDDVSNLKLFNESLIGVAPLTSSQNNCDLLIDVEDDRRKIARRSSTDEVDLLTTTSNRNPNSSGAEHQPFNLGDDQALGKNYQYLCYENAGNVEGSLQIISPFVEKVAGAPSSSPEQHSGVPAICRDHSKGGIGLKSLNSTPADANNHYSRGRFSPRDSHEKQTSDFYSTLGSTYFNERSSFDRLNYSGTSSSGMLVSVSNNDCYPLRSKHPRKISPLPISASPRSHEIPKILSTESSFAEHRRRDVGQHTITEKEEMKRLDQNLPDLPVCLQSCPDELEQDSNMSEEAEVELLSGCDDNVPFGIVKTEHDSLEQTSLISEDTEAALLRGVDISTNSQSNRTSAIRLHEYFETSTADSNAKETPKSLADYQAQQHPDDESNEANEWNGKDVNTNCNVNKVNDEMEITVTSRADQHDTSDETKLNSNGLADFYNHHKTRATPISTSETSSEGEIGDYSNNLPDAHVRNFTERKYCNLKQTISELDQFHSICDCDTDSRLRVCNTVIKHDVGETSIVRHNESELYNVFPIKSSLCSTKEMCRVESVDVTSRNDKLVTDSDFNSSGDLIIISCSENADPNTTLLSYKTDDSIESTVPYTDDGCHEQSNDIIHVPSETHDDPMELSMESLGSSLGHGRKSSSKALFGEDSSSSVVCLNDVKRQTEEAAELEKEDGSLLPDLSSSLHCEQELSPSRDQNCKTILDNARKYASGDDEWQPPISCMGDSDDEVAILYEGKETSFPQKIIDSCSETSNKSGLEAGDFNTSFNRCPTRQTAQQKRANNSNGGNQEFTLRQTPEENSSDLSNSKSESIHCMNSTKPVRCWHVPSKLMLKSDTDCINLRSKYLGNGLGPSEWSSSPSGYTSFHNAGFESLELRFKSSDHFDAFKRRKPNYIALDELVHQSTKFPLERSMSTTGDPSNDTACYDDAQDLSACKELELSANEDINVTHISNKIDAVRLEATSVTSDLEMDPSRGESEIDYSSEDSEVSHSREDIEVDHCRSVNEVEPAHVEIVFDHSQEGSVDYSHVVCISDRSREGSGTDGSRHESNKTNSSSVEVTIIYDETERVREADANTEKSVEEVSCLPGVEVARSSDNEEDISNVIEAAGVSDPNLSARTSLQ